MSIIWIWMIVATAWTIVVTGVLVLHGRALVRLTERLRALEPNYSGYEPINIRGEDVMGGNLQPHPSWRNSTYRPDQ